jgi:hypothetical protein
MFLKMRCTHSVLIYFKDQPFQDNVVDCGVYVSALMQKLAGPAAFNGSLRGSINPTNISLWRLEMLEKMQNLRQVPTSQK